jgi:secondary thiamine-phosphate synthase enzyme
MHTTHTSIQLQTTQQFEAVDISEQVQRAVGQSGLKDGIVAVTVPHTTAAIRLNHFEPLLMQDILRMLYRLAPQDISYNHDLFELRQNIMPNERSNGHAHVKAFLLGSSVTVPVQNGHVVLGDRQNIIFIECDGGRKRTVNITCMGDEHAGQ